MHQNNSPLYQSFLKSPHRSIKHESYFSVYDKLLSKYIDQDITFVEIGILDGGSLFMWRDFLGDKARIIGIEINPVAKKWEEHGFEIFIDVLPNVRITRSSHYPKSPQSRTLTLAAKYFQHTHQ